VLQFVAVCCSVRSQCDIVMLFAEQLKDSEEVVQCSAVCRSVLQCAAVWCSVLQCAAVYCSVLPCAAVCCSALQCVVLCVLQGVAVWCWYPNINTNVRIYMYICIYSVLQRVVVCCSVQRCFAVSCSVLHE